MQKFGLIVADPPWSFNDKLTYAKKDNVVRGAAGKYPTLDMHRLYLASKFSVR